MNDKRINIKDASVSQFLEKILIGDITYLVPARKLLNYQVFDKKASRTSLPIGRQACLAGKGRACEVLNPGLQSGQGSG